MGAGCSLKTYTTKDDTNFHQNRRLKYIWQPDIILYANFTFFLTLYAALLLFSFSTLFNIFTNQAQMMNLHKWLMVMLIRWIWVIIIDHLSCKDEEENRKNVEFIFVEKVEPNIERCPHDAPIVSLNYHPQQLKRSEVAVVIAHLSFYLCESGRTLLLSRYYWCLSGSALLFILGDKGSSGYQSNGSDEPQHMNTIKIYMFNHSQF